MEKEVGISAAQLCRVKTSFRCDAKNLLVQNICSRYDPFDISVDKKALERTNHVYTHKVNEVKPVTNQKSSGRCWIFALLNIIRQKFVQQFNLDEFEFSQQYLYFYDKIERSFFWLDVFEELARKKEDVDGRLMMFVLSNPMNDGGQWDMLVNLVEKYGLVPKAVWPDSYSATSSRRLNTMLNHKLRESALILREIVDKNGSEEELFKVKEKMMTEIYRITAICLGTPPEKFDWEYYDKSKKFIKYSDITPQKFYNDLVKPIFNMKDKVCLVNDPRPTSPYKRMYTVQYLGNMVNGQPTLYNNQPVEVLKNLAAAALKNGDAVWFGCDVDKHMERKSGALDLNMHNFDLTFGVSFRQMNKADRLLYGETLMTHAMTFTGYSCKEDEAKQIEENSQKGKPSTQDTKAETTPNLTQETKEETGSEPKEVTLVPLKTTKWRVENSWGDDRGDKGYLTMTDDWFSEYVFEVVVDRKYVPKDILSVSELKPIQLPAWDPMGALACVNCHTKCEQEAKL